MTKNIRWVTQYTDKGVLTSVPIDIDKYYAFEHILEDANKEVEAKDAEIEAFRIRCNTETEHIKEQDKQIAELRAAYDEMQDINAKLHKELSYFKAYSHNKTVDEGSHAKIKELEAVIKSNCDSYYKANEELTIELNELRVRLDRAGVTYSNQCVSIRDLRQKLVEHEELVKSLRADYEEICQANHRLRQHYHNKTVDADTVARLNLLNKDLLDKVAKLEQKLTMQEGINEYIAEDLAECAAELEKAKYKTRVVVDSIRATASHLLRYQDDYAIAHVRGALWDMSRPDFLSEYCND